MAQKHDNDGSVATETAPKQKLKKPTLYKVLLHNDNYTTREFVVAVLKEVFHKSESDAVQIMLHVHYNGVGVAGVYTFEVAETKLKTVEAAAQDNGFPLRLSMEPEEG
ncbi:ATP-dependent Clp protease adaptor ClpS [Myxococcus sp. MISCRS1]|jgi:ATP-dependent Clp protease adaptor protein ClpS|uniref:ATP-dependent Clp protease adapter protein ClpS n=1 Tax=Myxococcus fulvus TaxID=33 RepID=A0A511SXX5_MYXFU|nr:MULTISPECIES: ATP-dependent Clp protease adaptor ClpS [Myxococcus]AKF83437.1 ATP-dependent Clp protease ClpS [Myxococcus fulvus 124B02]BDT37111.1 ATP-dependent Clp protease adaptor ClpS [Myxococcus sp. MH1]MBZ4394350.1 ATP-dependent Clp protease adaptor ClpS [Myxococcus sp. AS-1-15]MBZ4410444.1 ATP-dependent Clp protease adaptor ClpS [Myxococcus sp. XM-1-1-1]MCK8502985.1 ATP-dependent Clp protease adaptor ClpS [Myxococcus fulvus]